MTTDTALPPPVTPSVFVPDGFVLLEEIAERSGKSSNTMRKHNVAEWEAGGLAMKDGKKHWWVNPSVIATLRVRGKNGDSHFIKPDVVCLFERRDGAFAAAERFIVEAIKQLVLGCEGEYELIETLTDCAARCREKSRKATAQAVEPLEAKP